MRRGTRLAAAILTTVTALGPALVVTGAAGAAPAGPLQEAGVDRPVVRTISPASGSTAGGTVVTITGAHLGHTTAVFFGRTKGTALDVRSDRRLLVTTPAGAAGEVPVRVRTATATSRPSVSFTYVTPTPPPPALGAVTVPAPTGAAANPGTELSAVDCAATTPSAAGLCRAVGTYVVGGGLARRPLLATRAADGSWSSVALPLPANAAADASPRLRDLECFTGFPDTCIAVGDYQTRAGSRASLVVRRVGTTATATSPVVRAAGDATVLGLVCFAETYCQAAGNVGDAPLALSWDGTAWVTAVLPLPSGATSGSIADLACLYPGRCFAVGEWVGPTGSRPLVEDGAGTAWVAASPALPADSLDHAVGSFTAVTCTLGCYAVGSYVTPAARRPLLALQYGMRGGPFQPATAVAAPGGTSDAGLTDVSCGGRLDPDTTASACVASGAFRSADGSPGAFLTDVSTSSSNLAVPVPSVGPSRIIRSADRIVCVATFVCGGAGNDTVVDGRMTSPSAFLFRSSGTYVEAGVAPTPAHSWRSHLDDVTLLPGADGNPLSVGLAVGYYLDPTTGTTQGLAVAERIQ